MYPRGVGPGAPVLRVAWVACLLFFFTGLISFAADAPLTNAGVVLTIEGSLEAMAPGDKAWTPARVGDVLQFGHRLRTTSNSRATVRLSNLSVLRIGPLMEYELEPPRRPGGKAVLNLQSGRAYLFSRDKPREIDFKTRSATGAIRGTEFDLEVSPDGQTRVTVIDGEVELTNAQGSVTLRNGEAGTADIGQAPVKTAVINAINIVQWSLYYPAVLDPAELGLEAAEEQALSASLAAYRNGDLLGALKNYPAGHQPASAAGRVYRAGVLLAVGKVDESEVELRQVESLPGNAARLAGALREMIAAVLYQKWERGSPPQLASEWMAESYYRQSRSLLPEALAAARMAAQRSPDFGYAWARVADLEFSFGRIDRAKDALNRGLQLAPLNAQAVTLQGFLLCADDRLREAQEVFERAIALDGGLGNAWLGRGLCRIRRGEKDAGREDIEVAAALEPNRSILRSYLGKAFSHEGDFKLADHELKLARTLDPNDPTSYLYSSLIKQKENRVNEAIADLEDSQARNDNRSVFRSRMLLDEDLAVRSANLASIYHDAGMTDVALREAARAVTYDYVNDSAHLFLSDSYNELRDPTRFNLRYETVWFNELLLANLLAPVGAGRLSQHMSQQEYSRMFDVNGLGLASSTTYRSDNKSVAELVSQYGTYNGTSYSFDLDYQHNDGFRVNNDLNDIEWYTTIKQQITPKDTALVIVKYEDYHSGDNFQYYYQTNARPNFQFDETQQPIVVGGWHHEWSPNIHTLALGGRLETQQHFSDLAAPQLLLIHDPQGRLYASDTEPFDVNYNNEFVVYTAELNQIFQYERVTLSAGARYQWGTFNATSSMTNPPGLNPLFPRPAADVSVNENFQRATGYGYLTVEPLDRVWLTGGLTYDDMTYPSNFRNPPVSPGESHESLVGPKAAVVWQPINEAALRGVYTKSLGGVSLDESYRLEPTQLAGFPQAFRSLISESVVGSLAAPQYQTYGLALDFKFPTRTYAGLQFDRLEADAQRTIGLFSLNYGRIPFVPGTTGEQLEYRENSFSATVNQLLGNLFVAGAGYHFTQADLQDDLPAVPTYVLRGAQQDTSAILQQITGYLQFNHPSGFFAEADVNWYHQSNAGYQSGLPSSQFYQVNLFAGYRFFHRHAELLLGILNVNGTDYQLNPLTVYSELPRERSFVARFNFIF